MKQIRYAENFDIQFLIKCNSAFHFYVYGDFIWILLIK